ncbi:ATP-binding cassette domain-containing protein [Lactobacillus gasseri]|uniref:UvrABC system protein A n=1 Tax=Lactobacillus gasseri TaxID=1596 RepID=A0AB33ZX98_LACGS|nr:ATP-binding cassette domain-containing protein [Lactobacillus gasseri]GBA97433.1 hypothetical protein LJCM1025_15410 [Lactobacillus gasseri]
MTAKLPTQIEVRGGRVHNLKNIDVNIPLHKFVAISGLSGSGKSSLAMGILYEEGSRRYLDALSTYMRRRIKQGNQANVISVKHIPSALALRQRPTIPSERATVGTMSETFNILRLIFSRLGSPVCPNGHRLKPSLEIAEAMAKSGEEMGQLTCPVCGVKFYAPSAEQFAFNSDGACEECGGTGKVRQLDDSKLISDSRLSIKDGAVASWSLPGRNFMPNVAEHAGVRIDIPYKDLTDKEKDFVLNGPEKKYKMDFLSGTGRVFHDFNALYENAHQAVLRSAKTSKSERAQKRISEFFSYQICPVCHGSRLKPELLKQLVGSLNINEVAEMPLGDLIAWKDQVLKSLPVDMQKMANALFTEFVDNLQPLLDLGLDYLTMARKRAEKINSVKISFDVDHYFNLQDVHAAIPVNQLTAVTGFSGAGKTSLILDSLVPAIQAQAKGETLPKQVKNFESPINQVVSVDTSPIGKSTRSTVATYTSIMDNLRKLFARQSLAKEKHYTPTYFSYNNKQGACPTCGGTGIVTLDIQFLPDMQQTCPTCEGNRYNHEVQKVKWNGYSIVDILNLDINEALPVFKKEPKIERDLLLLKEVGLDYLHLGESTPTLSGGEAQRLKLVTHLSHKQNDTLFVFDEPTIGLHPLDVKVLVQVMQKLLDQGATIITITHDLNMIVNADNILDLGPRGGKNGGKVVAAGQTQDLIDHPVSLTTEYLANYCRQFKK